MAERAVTSSSFCGALCAPAFRPAPRRAVIVGFVDQPAADERNNTGADQDVGFAIFERPLEHDGGNHRRDRRAADAGDAARRLPRWPLSCSSRHRRSMRRRRQKGGGVRWSDRSACALRASAACAVKTKAASAAARITSLRFIPDTPWPTGPERRTVCCDKPCSSGGMVGEGGRPERPATKVNHKHSRPATPCPLPPAVGGLLWPNGHQS